jgi:HEPN domain-containing protein
MSDVKHARMLLDVADLDRQAIHNMLDVAKFDDVIFGFHAQQAVEKCLKAWLSSEGVVYPRTHDLRVLYCLLEGQNVSKLDDFIDLVDLTDFAVQFRYELSKDLEPLDRQATIEAVDRLFGHVETLIRYV